jgi:YVTN family beta-propeller protein
VPAPGRDARSAFTIAEALAALTTKRGRADPGRSLTTVLFTDIVGSTETAAAVGDAAWKSLLARYYTMVRGRLVRFGGREIDTAGDGLFASFPAPAEAVRCAHSIRAGASELGITVRSGLHVGETETIEGKVGGIAVHIGARIAAAAGPNEVLVSGTVKDLVEGSGLRFEDRGEATLKGVPGTRRLYLSVPEPLPDTQAHTAATAPAAAAPGKAGLRARPSRQRWLVLATAEVVVLVVAAGLLLLPGSTGPAALASATPAATTGGPAVIAVGGDMVAEVSNGGVAAAMPVGGQPSGIAFSDDGDVWITNAADQTVSRLDPNLKAVKQTVPNLGPSPTAIAFGDGAIWVADSGGRTVSRINPATNTVVKQYTVGNGPSGIETIDSAIWVTDRLDGTLVELDPGSGAIERTIAVGLSPSGVAFGAGSLWVSDYDSGTVVRVDPKSGSVGRPIPVGNGASAVVASDSDVWVANRRDDTVSHVDPTSDSVEATIPLDGEPNGLAAGTQGVWVAVPAAASVTEIDATNRIVGRVTVAASPEAVAVRDGRPFFTTEPTEGSHQGGTLRIASDKSGLPTSVDPTYAPLTDVSALRLFLMTNDGLVAYRRVGGTDGQQLVPDLATSLPSASDGGLTYRFQLRSGITYSNGEPLMASDVLRTLRRTFVANNGANAFAGLLGATAACASPVDLPALPSASVAAPSKPPSAPSASAKACDLAEGIVVDDAAGTVTFHLTAPDPYFLYNLAQPWADILPASTPLARSSTPLPSTGPYVFDRIDSTSMSLKRNPRFRVWSSDAQPDGYPDAIQWSVGPDAVDAVMAGTADWTPDPLTAHELSTIETTLTDQLHIAPSTETFFEMLNTATEPFDKLEVRKAVNLAVDRAAAAAAFGGRVTCQVIPPGFAGYAPYCPYTINPDSSQEWHGPDLAAARSMIEHAGVKGETVTVWGPKLGGFQEETAYFVKLLDSLGFKARAKLISPDAFFEGLGSPTSGVSTSQVAGYWGSTSVATGAVEFPGFFTCPDFPPSGGSVGYPNHFCDPAIDQEIATGLSLEGQGDADSHNKANAIWVKVDRQIVDAAPAVMPFNPVDVDFLSKRTGGFQHHPFWNILLDQLWVQ